VTTRLRVANARIHGIRQAGRLAAAGAIVGLLIGVVARPLASRIAQDASLQPVAVLLTTALLIIVVSLGTYHEVAEREGLVEARCRDK
jgi:uncharacterized membrane protein YjfL (UPF0719 family)